MIEKLNIVKASKVIFIEDVEGLYMLKASNMIPQEERGEKLLREESSPQEGESVKKIRTEGGLRVHHPFQTP